MMRTVVSHDAGVLAPGASCATNDAVLTGTAANISTYPGDVRHLKDMLPHHIRMWGPNVDRIVVVVDTHRSRSGRYRASDHDRSLHRLRGLIDEARKIYPALESIDVDYSDDARRKVGRFFFGRDWIPAKAWDGGYFHSLLYGMVVTQARYVLHLDGDMFFGGGSRTWVQDAIRCMTDRPDVLLTAPFPGPPRRDAQIYGHQVDPGHGLIRENLPYPAYRQGYMSSRAFLMDMVKFKADMGVFPWHEPTQRQKLKARLLGHEPLAIETEVLISRGMQSCAKCRIDMLGEPPGMWSLHPPYRSEEFYERLPELVRRIEIGAMPEGQLGHFDLNDSVIDWSDARKANRWHHRYYRMLRHRFGKFA